LGGHKAAAIARIQKQAAIWLISSLPPDLVYSCGMMPFASVEQAMGAALVKCGPDSSVIVMPEGGAILPRVTSPERSQSGER
jgi:nickel-dependent lactate racemase